MGKLLGIKPTDKEIKKYCLDIEDLYKLGQTKESAVVSKFESLLSFCAKKVGWLLSSEYIIKRIGKRPDGAFLDQFSVSQGFMEAKDDDDDLEDEVRNKFAIGYPRNNTIFWQPNRIIIYQNNKKVFDAQIGKIEKNLIGKKIEHSTDSRSNLAEALNMFFEYEPPHYEQWLEAAEAFKKAVPELSAGLLEKINQSKKDNKTFVSAFSAFRELCQQSINPNISDTAIEEMIIQHLLTERLLRKVFDMDRFTQDNTIAHQLEEVISAMTGQFFNRKEFLGSLDGFYKSIEAVAEDIEDFSEKQAFINSIYEKFFQGWAVKSADTLGIVYTPQPVVDFMVRSVEEILKTEFGKSLSSPNVHILDPFVGTGNFIVRTMKEIKPTALQDKYRHGLHCNEIALMPYYIASMNIEHEFTEMNGKKYEPFAGICFADTFQMFEDTHYLGFAQAENSERVKKQIEKPIFVVITNPPYNSNQANENDNNKNRKYEKLEKEVSLTYSRDSKATNTKNLADPYVKAIKWASKRIGDEGVVAVITNNSFIDNFAFDGMRKHLSKDFDKIYHINLKGNARTSGERRRMEKGNVFDDQIRVSVGITFLIKHKERNSECEIYYNEVGDYLSSEEKKDYLVKAKDYNGFAWKKLEPNEQNVWLTEGLAEDFDSNIPLANTETRNSINESLFIQYSLGINTNRDEWVFNFNINNLKTNMGKFIQTYNSELDRWRKGKFNKSEIDNFVNNDETKIKWSSSLKQHLILGRYAGKEHCIKKAIYRPFIKTNMYFERILIHRPAHFDIIFPTPQAEAENMVISIKGLGMDKPFHAIMTNVIPDIQLTPNGQTYPFYTYNEDGTGRRENITDWSLAQFRLHYPSPSGGRCPEGVDEGVLDNNSTQPHPNPLLKGEGVNVLPPSGEGGRRPDEGVLDNNSTQPHPNPLLKGEGVNVLPPPGEGGQRPDEGVLSWSEYNKRQNLLSYACTMRKDSNDAEKVMWEMLRDRRFLNLKFRRQHVAGDFILDFYCKEKDFAIELDGGQHTSESNAEYDKKRAEILQKHGIKVVRFWNNDVLKNLESVMEALYNELADTQPHPNPLLEGEGGNVLPPSGEGGRRPDEGVLANNNTQPHPNPLLEGEGEITKWDIFYYVYAMLHHPKYREDYKENLRRSLPRIPYAPDFWAFSKIGKQLANLHVNYEKVKPYNLETAENREAFREVGYRIKKMKLTADKTQLVYNEAITFTGIPKEVYDYKLGNRSALEWIVDQYQVTTDPRSGITQDPNDFDGDPRYIFELIRRIVTVSLETVRLTKLLSSLDYK